MYNKTKHHMAYVDCSRLGMVIENLAAYKLCVYLVLEFQEVGFRRFSPHSNGEFPLSLNFIKERLRINRASLSFGVKELCELGFVEILKPKTGVSLVYKVNYPRIVGVMNIVDSIYDYKHVYDFVEKLKSCDKEVLFEVEKATNEAERIINKTRIKE